jgi:hypothetical protein
MVNRKLVMPTVIDQSLGSLLGLSNEAKDAGTCRADAFLPLDHVQVLQHLAQ